MHYEEQKTDHVKSKSEHYKLKESNKKTRLELMMMKKSNKPRVGTKPYNYNTVYKTTPVICNVLRKIKQ